MRVVLLVVLLLVTGVVPSAMVLRFVERDERDAQTAVSELGDTYTWPDSLGADDTVSAEPALRDAAIVTHVNVLRSMSETTSAGRELITDFVLMGRPTTALFRPDRLGAGRWITPRESREGAAVAVTTRRISATRAVGRPSVVADAFDLSIRPLHAAFGDLRVPGLYSLEGSSAAVHRFVERVREDLVRSGMPQELAQTILVRSPFGSGFVQGPRLVERGTRFIIWGSLALVGVAGVATALRAAKGIGVRRLLGFSAGRVWWHCVSRPVFACSALGIMIALLLVSMIPGLAPLERLLLSSGCFAAATVAAVVTFIVSTAIVGRMGIAGIMKGKL